MSRREKLEALLQSPYEGERAAARAALDRLDEQRPEWGTPEYFMAVADWHERIEWALSRMGTKGLTPAEVRTIRMFAKGRGTPWNRGADAFRAVYSRLKQMEDLTDGRLIPFIHTETV